MSFRPGPELLGLTVGAVELPPDRFPRRIQGKVRDLFPIGDRLVIVTTDRVSAFDQVLTTIPCKGEILNQLSLYWFAKTADIVANHVERQLGPRTILARACEVLPVEVVVRGYLTGSAWREYQKGGSVSGIQLPDGLRFNHRFENPLLTPATKAERGVHDEPISTQEVVSRGLVNRQLWREVKIIAQRLYARGVQVAAERGLILVDTKYEMGVYDGELVLVDELHTPDSSRYWYADTYDDLFRRGARQRKLDKEYLRQWLMDHGYMGNGKPPAIPPEVRLEVCRRYAQAFHLICGRDFQSTAGTAANEAALVLGAPI